MRLLVLASIALLFACSSRGSDHPAPPDAGPPRQLVTSRLLGDLPVENRVISPHFDLSSNAWYSTGPFTRVHFPRTPTHLPVLRMGKGVAVGVVRGGPPPLAASIWVGLDAKGTPPSAVAIVGLSLQAGEQHRYLLSEETESRVTLDSIAWRRYATRIDDELLGIATFYIEQRTGESLLNGPSVLPGEDSGQALRLSSAPGAPATLGEREQIRLALEAMERLGAERREQQRTER